MDIDAHMRSVLDLRSDFGNPKYYVGFGVRINTLTGHTFVIFGRENPDKLVSEIELRGFYPVDGIFDGDGIIKDEFATKKYISDYYYLIFTVDKPEYTNAKLALSNLEVKPDHYNVIGSNCVNLVQDMVGRIGIKSPSANNETPYSYLRSTLDKLGSEGLLYKGEALIKLINDGLTTAIYQNALDPDNSVVRMTGFGGFQLGTTKNGQLDGYVLTDMGEGGKLLFYYNEGFADFMKTKVIREGQIVQGGAFTNYNTPVIEEYSDGSRRTINIDPSTGNKLTSVFENKYWNCQENYFNDFTFFTNCAGPDGSRAESDMKLIFEDNYPKYVPSTNRYKLILKDLTFEGSCEYKEKKIYSKGLVKFSNGDTYEGEMVNWRFQGYGTYKHTENAKKFLGIRLGNSNSFESTGTWTNGVFDFHVSGASGVDPRAATVDAGQFKVPMEPPTTQQSPSDNQQPGSPAAQPIPPNIEPLPTAPVYIPPPNENYPEDIPPIKLVNPANSYYDPNSDRWILL